MRELLGLSFVHRERTRYRGRSSELLDIAFIGDDGIAVDLGCVDELAAIERTPSGLRIGAFASLHDAGIVAPELLTPGLSASAARLRLSLLGAMVTIAGGGATRRARMESVELAPHECPIAIEIPDPGARFGCADRRRVTSDGAASFALGVAVVLRIGERGAFQGVRIAVDLDGAIRRAALAEAKLEGARVDPGRFLEAARLAAYAIEARDARTSSAVRAVTPLALAALRDALAHVRPLDPPRRRAAR